MAKAVMVSFTTPATPEREAEFNAWYEAHAAEVVDNVAQIKEFSRYKVVDPAHPEAPARYLTIFEIDTDDVMEAAAGLAKAGAAGSLTMSDSLDMTGNPPVITWAQRGCEERRHDGYLTDRPREHRHRRRRKHGQGSAAAVHQPDERRAGGRVQRLVRQHPQARGASATSGRSSPATGTSSSTWRTRRPRPGTSACGSSTPTTSPQRRPRSAPRHRVSP